MSTAASAHVVVIGAGVVGVSSAIWLRRAGVNVTVVDRVKPGSASSTSYGNAGVLAACSVAPVTAPGLVRKSPKMLLDPDFPLFLRWSYLPKLMPWLLKYLSHANDKDTRRIAESLTPIIYDSPSQHEALAKGTDAEKWLVNADYSFAYPSKAAFEADAYTWMLRRMAGFEPDVLQGGDINDFEPALSDKIGLLAVMHDHGYVRDPGQYIAALAAEAEKLGAVFVQAEVKDFSFADGQVSSVITSQETLDCTQVVLATGVWSGDLARKLGLAVPLESERGYHIVFQAAEHGPRTPMMITSGKFVATPMKAGLRCAGVVEFGGVDAPLSKAPLELLHRKVRETFPNLTFEKEESWLGHRPAPSDSLPLIGEIGASGVFAGFGHHHIGLTAGPKTGRILAGLISGERQNIDLSAYDPQRF